MKNSLFSIKLGVVYFAVFSFAINACEVADDVSLVGDKVSKEETLVILKIEHTLPDSPTVPQLLKVIRLPGGKLEKRVMLGSVERLDEAMAALKQEGFSFPAAAAWEEGSIVPSGKNKNVAYKLSVGILSDELSPSKKRGEHDLSRRTLTFQPHGKMPARRFRDLEPTSRSATEFSRIRKVLLSPDKKNVLVAFGNCTEDIYAFGVVGAR